MDDGALEVSDAGDDVFEDQLGQEEFGEDEEILFEARDVHDGEDDILEDDFEGDEDVEPEATVQTIAARSP